jgi:hypothetical protein
VADHETLLGEINVLLAEKPRDRERMERTLTDGYAHALALEGERRRVEKQLRALAETIDRGDVAGKTREMSELARLIDHQDLELSELRALLAKLRAQYSGAAARERRANGR